MEEITVNTFKGRSRAHQLSLRRWLVPKGWTADLNLSPEVGGPFWKILKTFRHYYPYDSEDMHRFNLGHTHRDQSRDSKCDLCCKTISSRYIFHLHEDCGVVKRLWNIFGPPRPLTWHTLIANTANTFYEMKKLNRYLIALSKLTARRRSRAVDICLTDAEFNTWVSFFNYKY
ncbi:uncharacterized protein RJT20DRAFT_58674 [Scheffersomyces xylosifermentans]|uniref:uncharacterized protein n=1 Tax=Scheffersomyces xylosifermentans TaxID=1304137 RepID=UPI00315C94D7